MNEPISVMDVINHPSEWEAGDSGYWIAKNLTMPDGTQYGLLIYIDDLNNPSPRFSAQLSFNQAQIFGIGPLNSEDHIIERLTTILYKTVVNHYNKGEIPLQRSNQIWAMIANKVGKS